MFSTFGAVFPVDAEPSNGPALTRIDPSADRSPVRRFPSKPLHTHPCIPYLLAGLASVAAVTMLISLCSVSQRKLAVEHLHARQLADDGDSGSSLTPQCGNPSSTTSRSLSPTQTRLPLKKRKVRLGDEAVLGVGEEEWISSPVGSPSPVPSNSLLLELLSRPLETPAQPPRMQQMAHRHPRHPTPPPIRRQAHVGPEEAGSLTHRGMMSFSQQQGGEVPLSVAPILEAAGPSVLLSTGYALQASPFGALEQQTYPVFHHWGRQTSSNPGPADAVSTEQRPAAAHMHHGPGQPQGLLGTGIETVVGATGGQLERAANVNLSSEPADFPQDRASLTKKGSQGAHSPRPLLFDPSLKTGLLGISAGLPLQFAPTMSVPRGDSYFHHVYFRLPLLYPQIVLRQFCAAAAFSLHSVPSDPAPLLEQARRILRRPLINPESLEVLTTITEKLVSHAIVYQSMPVTHCTLLRALGALGVRFMILDAVLCVITLTGEQLPSAWFQHFASLVPDDTPPRPRKTPSNKQTRFRLELLDALSRALRTLKEGKRPCAREIVMLKKMLFCSPLSHRHFLSAPYDGWRLDNEGGESNLGGRE